MAEDGRREVTLSRLRKARYVARNSRGGELEVGEADDGAFTPGELLLVAIASCGAIDVDYITSKRAQAERFDLRISADKIRDELGNRLVNLVLEFDASFPEGEEGDAAREVFPSAVERSHTRLCTVSRTVEVGTPVAVRIVGDPGDAGDAGDAPDAG
jgi:uncharacterized OsmC-like protein